MQKSLSACSHQQYSTDQALIISFAVYRALHPIEQLMAQSLERIGKVRIVEDDDPRIVH